MSATAHVFRVVQIRLIKRPGIVDQGMKNSCVSEIAQAHFVHLRSPLQGRVKPTGMT